MCFAPQADLVAGIGVTAIGVDTCRNIRGRSDHLLLATLPLILGVHELVEDFVWWGLQGHVPHEAGRVALWAYMFIAFVLLPVFVPLAVLVLEPTVGRKRKMVPFGVLGLAVSTVLLVAMLRGPIGATQHPWHLSYSIALHHAVVVVVLYVVAICGALLFSGYRHIVVFGLANLAVVIALA